MPKNWPDDLYYRHMRFRIIILFFAFLAGFCKNVMAQQTFNWRIAPTVAPAGDFLFIDYYIEGTGTAFDLGSSNFVLHIGNPAAIDINSATITFRGNFDQLNHSDYLPMTITPSLPLVNPRFLNLSVLANTSCVLASCGSAVGTEQLFATVQIPIINCSDTLSLNWRKDRGVITDYDTQQNIKSLGTFTSPLNLNLCPASIFTVNHSDADLRICPNTFFSSTVTSFSGITSNTFDFWVDGSLVASNVTSFNTDTFTINHNIDIIGFNACGCSDTFSYSLNVYPLDTTLAVTAGTGCFGRNTDYTLPVSELNVTYQVLNGTLTIGAPVVGTGGPISLAIPSTDLILGVNVFDIQATSVDGCIGLMDNVPPITVVLPPTPSINGPSFVVIPASIGYNTTLNANSSYVWTISSPLGNTIQSQSSNTAIVDFNNAPSMDTLMVTETNASGCSTTDTLIIDVSDCPAVAGNMCNDTLVCIGDNVPLYIETFFGAIQWQKSPDSLVWTDATGLGATSQVFFDVNVTDTTYYRVIVFAAGCSDTSTVVTVFADTLPTVGTLTANINAICSGVAVNFNLSSATGNIQWQESPDGLLNWTDIPLANTLSFTSNPLITTTYYRVKVSGCDSVFSNVVQIQVIPSPQGTFDTAPTNVCHGTETAPLGATLISGTGVWSTPDGLGGFSNSTDPNAYYISNLADPSNVTLVWTVSAAGCVDSIYSQILVLDDLPSGTFSKTPSPVCAGISSDSLGATASIGVGHWEAVGGNGGSFSDINDPNTVYNTVAAESNSFITLQWIINNGNCPADTLIQILTVVEPPAGSFTTPIPDICSGDKTINLNANLLIGNGFWTTNGQGAFIDPTIPNTQYLSALTDNGPVTLYWHVVNGSCPEVLDSQIVNISPSPQGEFSTLLNNICVGDTSQNLGATLIAGTGIWQTPNGTGFFENPTDPNTRYVSAPTDAAVMVELLWVVTNGVCTPDTNRGFLFVGGTPFGTFDIAPTAICAGSATAPLGATVSLGSGVWVSNGSGGFTNALDPNASYLSTIADSGKTIQLSWVVSSGSCPASIYSQDLFVFSPPRDSMTVLSLDTICSGGSSVHLGAMALTGTGIWSTPNGAGSFSNVLDPNAVYFASLADGGTNVILKWTVSNGPCPSVADSLIQPVSTDSIVGSFNTPPAPICVGSFSAPLGATVAGTNAIGLWSHNGFGFFSNPSDPNAFYISVAQDGGNLVQLTWTVSNSKCTDLVFNQNLRVDREPIASFPFALAPVCGGDTSADIQAFAFVGTGHWEHSGNGFFIPNDSANIVQYVTSPLDTVGGSSVINISWITENGVCTPDTLIQTLAISRAPEGNFTTVIPDVCAGGITIPLNAVVTSGVGTWSSDGTGTFSDLNDPNAFYNSTLDDSNKTVLLTWTIASPGCANISFVRPVNVTNLILSATFDVKPADICVGDTTDPFVASSINAVGTFWTTTGNGTFFPNNTDPNAQYISDPLDAGDTIKITWNVYNPTCDTISLSQNVIVYALPDGSVPASIPNICFGGTSIPLGAVTNVGIGHWESTGTGGITNALDPNAQYVSGIGDAGSVVSLLWIVESGPCIADTNLILLQIDAPPAGAILSPSFAVATALCAGSTRQLVASVSTGTGYWVHNGNGKMVPDSLSPTAGYFSSNLDAGDTVQVMWIVTNGVCKNDTNIVFIPILNSLIIGDFPDLPDTSICATFSTNPLGASISSGIGFWQTTGAGTFSPSINNPNAVYQSDVTDANKTIDICWVMTNTGCDSTFLCQQIFVQPRPLGSFPFPPSPICVTDTSDTLLGFVSVGTGRWVTNGTGTFTNPNSDTTQYIPGLADAGTTVQISWAVSNTDCDTIYYSRNLQVFAQPLGDFTTFLDTICVGEATVPLGASVTTGIGFWRTNGAGGFTNSNDPNSLYISFQSDGGQDVTLSWVVFNGPCDSVMYQQTFHVDTTAVGSFPNVLPSVCEGDSTPPLGAIIVTGSGFWTATGPGTFIDPTDPNTMFIAGDVFRDTTFSIQWNITNGRCPVETFNRFLKVFAAPEATIDTTTVIACPGNSTQLSATPIWGSGRWRSTSGNGSFFPFSTDPNATFTPSALDAGNTIQVFWSMFNGVCDTVRYYKTIIVNLPPIANAGPDTTICPNTVIQLQASGGLNYFWIEPASGFSNNSVSNPFVSPLDTTRYVVRVIDSLGCQSLDTMFVNVYLDGNIDAGPASTTICGGDSILITATGNFNSIVWSPGFLFQDSTATTTWLYPDQSTIITATGITPRGCVVTDSRFIDVLPFSTPVIVADDVCQGLESYLYSITDATCQKQLWFEGSRQDVIDQGAIQGLSDPFVEANALYVSNIDSVVADTANIGLHSYTLVCRDTVQNCIGIDETTIQTIPFPIAAFTADRTVVPYNDRFVNFTSNSVFAVNYYWVFGDTASGNDNNFAVTQNPSHLFSGPGVYTVALFVTNELDCADLLIQSNIITVRPPEYTFPSAFTPNKDNLNDRFRAIPNDAELKVQSMQIFDRWGQVVFESENDNSGWSGYTKDGKPFDPGTYTYRVLIELPAGFGTKAYTGYITLIR